MLSWAQPDLQIGRQVLEPEPNGWTYLKHGRNQGHASDHGNRRLCERRLVCTWCQ